MATPAQCIQVTVDVFTPEQLTMLLKFCSDNGMSYTPVAAAAFTPQIYETELKRPTREFMDLCGPEWLTPKKLISPASVYQFLCDYITSNRLVQPDGAIHLNAPLLSAFPTASTHIYRHDILKMVDRAFV